MAVIKPEADSSAMELHGTQEVERALYMLGSVVVEAREYSRGGKHGWVNGITCTRSSLS